MLSTTSRTLSQSAGQGKSPRATSNSELTMPNRNVATGPISGIVIVALLVDG